MTLPTYNFPKSKITTVAGTAYQLYLEYTPPIWLKKSARRVRHQTRNLIWKIKSTFCLYYNRQMKKIIVWSNDRVNPIDHRQSRNKKESTLWICLLFITVGCVPKHLWNWKVQENGLRRLPVDWPSSNGTEPEFDSRKTMLLYMIWTDKPVGLQCWLITEFWRYPKSGNQLPNAYKFVLVWYGMDGKCEEAEVFTTKSWAPIIPYRNIKTPIGKWTRKAF